MNRLFVILTTLVLWASCTEKKVRKPSSNPFTTEVLLKTTPVKDQGTSTLCWAYAMLATIETNRLMQGDSVHLSPFYAGRMLLEEQAQRYYLTQGKQKVSTRGMSTALLHLIEQYGMLAYDTYPDKSDVSIAAVERQVMKQADMAMAYKKGLQALQTDVSDLLDSSMGFKPRYQFMGGAEYTVQQFGRSVYRPGDYVPITSWTHQPFGKPMVLETPDNHYLDSYLNLPIDNMMSLIEGSIRKGYAVCWEGDISEKGFSFQQGVAILKPHPQTITQETRQHLYEQLQTTDDHCMAVIGLARSKKGKKYFILKNSWGTNNAFGGLLYMSYDYMKLKTLCVILHQAAFKNI